MANHINKDPAFVRPSKGRGGHVRLTVGLDPYVRASLVRLAESQGRTLVDVCADAFSRYLEQEWLG